MQLNRLIKSFEKLDIDRIINNSFRDTKSEFKNIQREQLMSGRRMDGSKISPKYRNRNYATIKHDMNPGPGLGTPDLRLTGDFYKKIEIKISPSMFDDDIEINSRDLKNNILKSKYDNIFGLGNEFHDKYVREALRPEIKKNISAKTGLRFNA